MRGQSFLRSVRCALQGMVHAVRSQRNARVQLVVAVLVVLLGNVVGLERTEWCVVALTIGAVLAAETANTALEAIVDLVSPEYHEQARIAKDAAAGAVLIVAVCAVVVGVLIFGPPVIAWFSSAM